MTVKLTVRSAIWRSHVARAAAGVDGLVPVVKGNGYGFGRAWLAGVAAEFADTIAVGNVHELDGLPGGVDVVVLTPLSGAAADDRPDPHRRPAEHVAALDGWRGRVIVKLSSAMRRYGADARLSTSPGGALDVVGVSVHPPLAGEAAEHVADVARRARDRRSAAAGRGSATSTPSATPTLPATAATACGSARRCGTATSRRCTSPPTCSTSARSAPASRPATGSGACPATATS